MSRFYLRSGENKLVMFIHARGMEIKLINRYGLTRWNVAGYPQALAAAFDAVVTNDDADAPAAKGFYIGGPHPFKCSVAALGSVEDERYFFFTMIDRDKEQFHPGEGSYHFCASREELSDLLFHFQCYWLI